MSTILREAYDVVHLHRGVDYGDVSREWGRVGVMWGAILGTDPIPARTCLLMMAALKIAREAHAHKRDNLVDLSGYAECAAIVTGEQ